jgi:hypothetical protein
VKGMSKGSKILAIAAVAFILGEAAIEMYGRNCFVPAREARTMMVHSREVESEQFARTGKLSDRLDDVLLSEADGYGYGASNFRYILGQYHFSARPTGASFQIVSTPRRWCFCRPTFMLGQGEVRRVDTWLSWF